MVGADASGRVGGTFFSPGEPRAAERGDGEVGVVSWLAAVGAIALWLAWTLLLIPPQAVAVALDLPLALRIPMLYHRGICRIFGVEVETAGAISAVRPTLFVADHCSYFDIPVLGSLLQASFVAKEEIRAWPLLGLLARLQNSIFISRRIADTRAVRDQIASRLRGGSSLILFPEGTTNDGNHLLPFRPALFSLADRELAGTTLAVQPVTVAYVRQNGVPIGYASRARFAWFGDMALARHFFQAIQGGRITVVVRLHPPVDAARFTSRRALAQHCFEQVAAGLEAALRGAERAGTA